MNQVISAIIEKLYESIKLLFFYNVLETHGAPFTNMD